MEMPLINKTYARKGDRNMSWMKKMGPVGTVAIGVGCMVAAPLCASVVTAASAVVGAVGVTAGVLSTASAVSAGSAAAGAAAKAAVSLGGLAIAQGLPRLKSLDPC